MHSVGGWFSDTIVYVPFSYLALLYSILPLLAFVSIRRRRKLVRDARLGLCPTCGYNLRVHKPGDKCPECGTPVASPAEPIA